MDILSHTLTGMAVGTVIASFSRGGFKRKSAIILAGTLAGAIPDIDALSLWSKFDSVIGETLGLSHSGREIYFGKLWYSHHGMMHSLLMSVFFPLAWWLLGGSFSKNRQPLKSRLNSRLSRGKFGMIAFFFGYALHLIEDMITPSGSWGGVRLFFPSTEYYGGFGKIWWWNNYDLFLLIITVIFLNCIALLINKKAKQITSGLFILASTLFFFQIQTRGYDFQNRQVKNLFTSKENKSKEIQKGILGEKFYQKMQDFDNSISLNF